MILCVPRAQSVSPRLPFVLLLAPVLNLGNRCSHRLQFVRCQGGYIRLCLMCQTDGSWAHYGLYVYVAKSHAPYRHTGTRAFRILTSPLQLARSPLVVEIMSCLDEARFCS